MDHIIMETLRISTYALYAVTIGAVVGAVAISYIIGRLERNRPHDTDNTPDLTGTENE